MASVHDMIENKDLELDRTDHYAAIIGESPSQGARSPVLWNAAFERLSLSGVMHPMDVVPDRLKGLVEQLKVDGRFIGGAVTMPYKIDIIPCLDAIETEAEIIGAVNCLYRDGQKIIGANTDGAGALWSLQNKMKEPLSGKTVLIIGTGGAGLAVAAYIASAVQPRGKLILANRTRQTMEAGAAKLSQICRVECVREWPLPSDKLSGIDVLINCTGIGFENIKKNDTGYYSLKFYSPLGVADDSIGIDSADKVEKRFVASASDQIAENIAATFYGLSMMNDPVVFDIIYQPRQTLMLSCAELMGFKTLNGIGMNLEQAVIAFDKATAAAGLRSSSTDDIREIMQDR